MTKETQIVYNGNGYIETIEDIDAIFNSEPKEDWLKKEVIDGKEVLYLPIEKVEFLLRRLLKDVDIYFPHPPIEGLKNIVLTVSVLYTDRNGLRRRLDGIASLSSSESKKGAFAMLKSFAIKDAVHILGAIFGGNLNRLDEKPANDKIVIGDVLLKKLVEEKKSKLSAELLVNANRIVSEKEINSYKKLYNYLNTL